jgi:two-component system, chemotaxis family, chemotaxis protein CheY
MFDPETKVLVVDDFKTMRKIVIGALGTCGLKNVTEAEDGIHAWPLIEAAAKEGAPFGLVVSDWNMPQLSGLELLRKVRALESTRKTPFVLVTAEAEQKNILEAVQAGVSNYVVKPFTPATFKEKLEQVHSKLKK